MPLIADGIVVGCKRRPYWVESGCSDDKEAAVQGQPEAEGRLTATLPPDAERKTKIRSGRRASVGRPAGFRVDRTFERLVGRDG